LKVTPQKLSAIAPWLALLAISVLINYVDRGNLSIAAPLLKDELHLNPWQLGILLSAFFWTYTALLFVVGWLVDRFEVNVVIATGYLVWSLATVTTGLVHGFALLLVTRLVLGIGESVAFPSCSKILALHVSEERRGFANGAIITGIRSGPAIGMFGAGLLMAKYGWRPVFIGIGLVSLVWLPAWKKWMPRGHVLAGSSFKGLATITAMLRKRSFWGASAGHFCGNYLLYVMVTWLPFYLVRERHLSMNAMARIAGLYFLVDATSAMAAGALSDLFIRRGYTTTLVRKSVMAIGHTTGAIGMAACALAGPHSLPAMASGRGSGMRNRSLGHLRVLPDPCWAESGRHMDRLSGWLCEFRGCDRARADRVYREPVGELSHPISDHVCGCAGGRHRLGLWSRPGRSGHVDSGGERSARCVR
jgi:MFS family permease